MTAEEALAGVSDRLVRITRRVTRVYGMDPEEARAEALYLFVLARHEYTPARGDFGNWVAFFVHRRLRSAARDQARRSARYRSLGDDHGQEAGRFDPRDLRLSQDARTVVEAILTGLVSLEVPNPRPRTVGGRLRERVRIHFLVRDWSERRVRRAMVELRETFS